MERELRPQRPKLAVAASLDYPAASEVLVSFADRWELIQRMNRGDDPLYLAAMPPAQERPRRDHFHGLPPEINLEMATYRLYRFFQPWPVHSFYVLWDRMAGTGRIVKPRDFKVQLQPLGQAQAWFGQQFGVIWECYFYETRRGEANWQDKLREFWRAVEEDIGVAKIFTQPHEPTFVQGYPDFLSCLGYAPDPLYEGWWSK